MFKVLWFSIIGYYNFIWCFAGYFIHNHFSLFLQSFVFSERHLTIINNPSNKPISIKCTGNSVITISNISVEADSKCKSGNCSLSEQDKFEARNQCNGKSSCNITSNISNSCLLELGFFSLSYSCLGKYLGLSNFNYQKIEWCNVMSYRQERYKYYLKKIWIILTYIILP